MYEYQLARERQEAEQYSTGLGVVLPVFCTISPDKASERLDIQKIAKMAGYERREDESEDEFLQMNLIPKFTLIKSVMTKKVASFNMLLACAHPIAGLLTPCSCRTDKG